MIAVHGARHQLSLVGTVLAYRSYWSSNVHVGVPVDWRVVSSASSHLSGIPHGRMHEVAVAGEHAAVAVA